MAIESAEEPVVVAMTNKDENAIETKNRSVEPVESKSLAHPATPDERLPKTTILHSVSNMINQTTPKSRRPEEHIPMFYGSHKNITLDSSGMPKMPFPSFYDLQRPALMSSFLSPGTFNRSMSTSPFGHSSFMSWNNSMLRPAKDLWLSPSRLFEHSSIGSPHSFGARSLDSTGRDEECRSVVSDSANSSEETIVTEQTQSPASSPRLQPPQRRNRERTWLPCEVCSKKFDRPSLLRRHMRTHTGEKPHACDVCGKAFSTSSSLNTHRRIHSGEKPHQCTVCGKRFTASSNLYYHKMTHNKEKPHKCTMCSKSFPTPGDLKSHMYVHNGCWPFKCDICNRGFSKQTNMKNHIMLHTGDKPHECRLCGKRFALHCNLKTHTRTHEGEAQERCYGCHEIFLIASHKLYQGLCKGCMFKNQQPMQSVPSKAKTTASKLSSFSIAELTKEDNNSKGRILMPTAIRMADMLLPSTGGAGFNMMPAVSGVGLPPVTGYSHWPNVVTPSTVLSRY